jgi:hypothetical protein
VIKSRRLRWAGHVARIGDKRDAYRVFMGKPEGKGHLEISGVYQRIILKWIFEKRNGAYTGSIWLRIGTSDGLL